VTAAEFVVPSPFPALDVMPSHPRLEDLQGKLESRYKIYKLREALENLSREYDRIWIDTPPALNFYTRSALIAADRCLIPFDCDDFSRRALYTLIENVQEIRLDHNRGLSVEGIVVNQFQARASLPRQDRRGTHRPKGLPVLHSYLSASVKIRESHRAFASGDSPGSKRHKVTREYLELHASLG
jgi:chromosome partitioning protein